MRKNTLWVATLDTRHYNFEAYGETKAEALAVMASSWRAHRRECGGVCAPWSEFKDDVSVREVSIGSGYRDGFELSSRKR